MRVPYLMGVARRPQPALGGSLLRPRPMMPVQFAVPGSPVTRTSVLDTGADDTVLPDWIAAALGLDLTRPRSARLAWLAARRYAPVEIQISAVECLLHHA
jgi:hypothetical protein